MCISLHLVQLTGNILGARSHIPNRTLKCVLPRVRIYLFGKLSSAKNYPIRIYEQRSSQTIHQKGLIHVSADLHELMSVSSSNLVQLALDVHYPDDYPDALPELSLVPIEGDISEDEIEELLQSMRTVVSCGPFMICCVTLHSSISNNRVKKTLEWQ